MDTIRILTLELLTHYVTWVKTVIKEQDCILNVLTYHVTYTCLYQEFRKILVDSVAYEVNYFLGQFRFQSDLTSTYFVSGKIHTIFIIKGTLYKYCNVRRWVDICWLLPGTLCKDPRSTKSELKSITYVFAWCVWLVKALFRNKFFIALFCTSNTLVKIHIM